MYKFVAILLSLQFLSTGLAQKKYDVREDVVYGHKDGMALTYDVFTPKENSKGVGLLFMVSGGCSKVWSAGSISN
jgi:hypothetical protein